MFAFLRKNNFTTVNVNDLADIKEKINLVDIREPYEYHRGHLSGAKNIPMGTLLSNPDKYLSKDKTYHIICQSGGRSLSACNELDSAGYDVINVGGGTGSFVGSLKR
ncbi:MAG TPA: rhodanese-like domain-containing protein [Eubacteriaceae bacterium]|jgi:rhodanese-related sulfurtransferase|nr:rhodanese-like domain-containing protein [Eubacteriaceae bacterium]